MSVPRRDLLAALGPGFLFAGAAVGVSHLVQSTRAGAEYGLGLLLIVLAANLFKYPAFVFGPHYAAATGTSLLEGYRRQGRWTLWLYALLTVGTMFTVGAAVTVVTAGLAKAVFGLAASPVTLSVIILLLCAVICGVGHYRALDRSVKALVGVLTVGTVIATVAILPRVDWSPAGALPTAVTWDRSTWMFVAALVGWMPSAIDVSVWSSLWTLARARDAGVEPQVAAARLDFDIGYAGTVALALCFLLLGAGVMHGTGVTPSPSAGGFANQIVHLYTESLGAWSAPIIGTAAVAVMFSTTLTVLDGFPRAITCLVARLRGPEAPEEGAGAKSTATYWGTLTALAIGSIALIVVFVAPPEALRGLTGSFGFRDLIDLATTLSFLTAPALAWLNHRAVFSGDLPPEDRPGPGMRRFSLAGIAFLSTFATAYLVLRFT